MFTRRIIFLFVLVSLAAAALILRLVHMQLLHADAWRDEAKAFVNRHQIIETSRGAIVDRHGVPVARDKACTDLAIDYRAICLDDQWLKRRAVERLRLEVYGDRNTQKRLPPATKTRLKDVMRQIENQITQDMPAVIADQCHLSVDEVKLRIDGVKERVSALREHLLLARLEAMRNAQNANQNQASGLEEMDPENLPPIQDEQIAHTIVENVSPDVEHYFEKHLEEFPGLVTKEGKLRVYPKADVAAHVIGFMRPVDAERLHAMPFVRPNLLDDKPDDLKGYLPGDRAGSTGVERYAEMYLRGARGVRLTQLDGPRETDKQQDPVPGQDVRLTIDMALQEDLHKRILNPQNNLLKGDPKEDRDDTTDHNIALVVLDIASGDVLVMISTPSFDLRTIDADYGKLAARRNSSPLINRTVAVTYPPGSTLKPFVATTALANGVVTPSETLHCTGLLYPNVRNHFKCDAIHNDMQLVPAIEQSCNVYFYTMGSRLGLERLLPALFDFGLGHRTQIGLPDEVAGSLRGTPTGETDAQKRQSLFAAIERISDLQQRRNESTMMGIGQGPVAVTPLQLAAAYATLLRGGQVVTPRILADEVKPNMPALPLDPAQVQYVRQGMELVVQGSHGTAHSGFKGMRMRIAGKTGTATERKLVFDDQGNPVFDPEQPILDANGRPALDSRGQARFRQLVVEGTHAWFVGYVPADQPRYVICAIKEFGGHGGRTAVPLVREAILALERHTDERQRPYLAPLDLDTATRE